MLHKNTLNAALADLPAAEKRFRIHFPVIVAAGILVLTLLLFGIWKMFFNHSLTKTGVWLMTLEHEGKSNVAGFAFDEENDTCRYYNGSVTYRGVYKTESKDGHSTLHMAFSEYGEAFGINYDYTFEGISWGDYKLKFTEPKKAAASSTQESSEKESSKQESSEQESSETSVQEDNDNAEPRSYTLKQADEFPTPYSKIENASVDKKLLGIWVHVSERNDIYNDNTFAFYDDGTYQLTYRDCSFKGCYSAKDGVCTFNIIKDGKTQTMKLSYTFGEENRLILNNDSMPMVYYPTDNLYAFETGIK